jgi:hypothetical protein
VNDPFYEPIPHRGHPGKVPLTYGRVEHVRALNVQGATLRHMADLTGLSKDQVHRIVSQRCLA